MIVVTGATGKLGHRIVEKLLAMVPAEQIGVSVRDAGKATAYPTVASGYARPTSPIQRRWLQRLRARTRY